MEERQIWNVPLPLQQNYPMTFSPPQPTQAERFLKETYPKSLLNEDQNPGVLTSHIRVTNCGGTVLDRKVFILN